MLEGAVTNQTTLDEATLIVLVTGVPLGDVGPHLFGARKRDETSRASPMRPGPVAAVRR